MAVRDDFTAGEVLAAADLNDTFASKLDLAGGKILQIVRGTSNTAQSTSSTSDVDMGISVTITPQIATSAVLLFLRGSVRVDATNLAEMRGNVSITDNSNNYMSGAEQSFFGTSNYTTSNTFGASIEIPVSLFAYATPATTSATTYKGRFRVLNASASIAVRSDFTTTQLYAIEVSA